MSLLSSGLETHPTGTFNKNPIINGNWQVLENLLTGTVLAYGATVTVPMNRRHSLSTITGNVIIAVSEKVAGRETFLTLIGSGGTWNITWPVGATWEGGSAPATIAAGERLTFRILSNGTADADLVFIRGPINYTAGTGLTLTGSVFAVDAALVAFLASPTFSGIPAAPTAAPGTNTTQLATTAFVFAAAAAAPGTIYTAGTGIDVTGTVISITSAVVTLTGSQTISGQKTMTAPILNGAFIEAETFKLNAAAYVELTSSRAATNADNGKILWSSAAYTLTVPDSLTKPFGCTLKQEGAGAITVAVSGTAVLRNVDSHTKTGGQWSFAAIDYRTGNDVVLSGRTAT